MSKEFKRQKAVIGATKKMVESQSNLGGSAFGRDLAGRAVNRNIAEKNSVGNTQRGGNPLSVIANEKTPNPVRRMKAMNAVKANSKSSKGL